MHERKQNLKIKLKAPPYTLSNCEKFISTNAMKICDSFYNLGNGKNRNI